MASVTKHRIWRQVLPSLVLHLCAMTVASCEVVKYCYALLSFSEGCSEAQGMYTFLEGKGCINVGVC